ncbi:MAG: DedA family protein [Methylobacteriaceae bacterium]|jgi:membrane protein DedA with SNARE-associated domain|nr:DedA family protein [Methylobacteriaceae bacterium]
MAWTELEALKNTVLGVVAAHHAAAPLVIGVLAFLESLVVVSLFVPATTILFGVGFLIANDTLMFWPVYFGAAAGAYLGDTVSYLLGFRFKRGIFRVWPLYRFPAMIFKGRTFFRRWGLASVFIGRFFGPIRAVIPLIAGVFQMPWPVFQISNISSALLWALALLAPGMGLGWFLGD